MREAVIAFGSIFDLAMYITAFLAITSFTFSIGNNLINGFAIGVFSKNCCFRQV